MSKDKKKKYKKKKLWGPDVEVFLCELWEQRISEIRQSRKNSHIFKEMSAEMQQRGVYFTPSEIHVKINNLTAKYRKEKSQLDCTGGSRPEWPLFFKIHAILGKFKADNVEFLTEDSVLEESLLEEYLDEVDDVSDQKLAFNDYSNGNTTSNEGQPTSSGDLLKRKQNAYCNVGNANVKKFKSRNDLEMDSDYNFLLSVMPQMKKMSLENNFQFRIDIMKMLMKINQNENIAKRSNVMRAQVPIDQDETSDPESTSHVSEKEPDIKTNGHDCSTFVASLPPELRHSENGEHNLNINPNKRTKFLSGLPQTTKKARICENEQEEISDRVSIDLDDNIIPKIEPNF